MSKLAKSPPGRSKVPCIAIRPCGRISTLSPETQQLLAEATGIALLSQQCADGPCEVFGTT